MSGDAPGRSDDGSTGHIQVTGRIPPPSGDVRRRVEVVVVSDVHLGLAASRAAELNAYLKTVDPGRLVLLGDIVDLWQIRRGFWPEAHTKVVRRILKFAAHGTPVDYVAGNHDGALRAYGLLALGGLRLHRELTLTLDGRRHWFVHGDAFDHALGTGRLAAWLGGHSYDLLTAVGVAVNHLRRWTGHQPVSLAQAVRRRLPMAQAHVERFVAACRQAAARRGMDAVIAGHIHVPDLRPAEAGLPAYLNSGDWVDHGSALEYAEGAWSLASTGAVSAAVLDDAA